MNKMVLFGVAAVLLFVLSASLSWLVQSLRHATQPSETAGEAAQGMASSRVGGPPSPAAGGEQPPANPPPNRTTRPPYTPGTDDAVQLANTLRERLAAVRERESKLETRQNTLELLYQDIRGERAGIEGLRQQVSGELKSVDQKLAEVEKRFQKLLEERQKAAQDVASLEKNRVELESAEETNIRKMAAMYDTMEPESAARILERLSDSKEIKGLDTAVKLLGYMRERQAARVLAAIDPSSGLAPQLLERLKGLKKPSAKPKAATAP